MKCKKKYKDMEKFAEYKRRSTANYNRKTSFYNDETYGKKYSKEEIISIFKHDIPDREGAEV